jgi:RNA polymerase sigma factor (sigma-70 family)
LNVDLPACIAGSQRAWDDFVRAAAPIIYAGVRRSLRTRGVSSPAEIDDRVQDVFVRLLRDDCRLLRTFDPARASLPTWLTLIARTVVHEHQRKRSLPTHSLEAARSTEPASSTSPPVETTLSTPLGMLSDQQKQVIGMLFEEGLSVEQAAARLGVEAQTIRSAKHKALTKLREHLAAHVEGPGKRAKTPGMPGLPGRYNQGER